MHETFQIYFMYIVKCRTRNVSWNKKYIFYEYLMTLSRLQYGLWFQVVYSVTYLSTFLIPDHKALVTGGINRREPVGGLAYGIPLNASTGSKWRPSKWIMVPDSWPYFVCTTLDVSWAWSLYASSWLPPSPPEIGVNRGITISITNNILRINSVKLIDYFYPDLFQIIEKSSIDFCSLRF